MFILNTKKNFFAIIINIKIGEKIMKKLAILGSAKSCVLEDILKYFNGCLMMSIVNFSKKLKN